ncbi:thioredoxin-like protein [Cantharellus anzutake]|uniref:thioredoxin-like protein n=1 Tax=Cantharellus anzutake TaxID=1750568 RepID=UPI0019066F78|nr:thioredoxin-like protein [Cantharellus anzutake]KAF8327799.1 thioredoxin-like protein [Cantharellus anzutake]
MLAQALALSLVLPVLVSAGIFPPGGPVKMLQDTVFRKTLKDEKTSVVAFVAPWCGHCKNLSPEYSKAAQSLSPLIDFYAVDCDADENKRLCAEQGVKGFPTVKSFPRGLKGASHDYHGERTAASIASWAGSEVPARVTTLKSIDAVNKWSDKDITEPRALLLTTQSKIPVLWKVLGSRFYKDISFGATKDESGSITKSLGLGEWELDIKSKVAIWKKGAKKPTLYDGKSLL